MNCPLCIEQTLEVHRRSDIEIDVCPNCHGVWLDRDELERLMGADASTGRASLVQRAPDHPAPASDKPKSGKKNKSGKKKGKKKSLGERLGDVLEDVLDI